MERRQFLTGLGLVCLMACTPRTQSVTLPPGTTLIVVRHGEKDGDALTSAGVARAEALASALGETPIDRIYSTSYRRNIATAEPLAEAQGLSIETVPDFDVTPKILAGNAGRTILWVGNKGNIAPMWDVLGLTGDAPLAYGDLAFVRADGTGRISVAMTRFGS